MNSAELLQFVVSGLQNGAVYALVALGFTLVYASTGIINFAQGEFFMLGGMLAVAGVRAGLPLPFAVVASVIGTAAIGLLFERVALRPRRDSGPLVLIIITIGGSMVMKSLARHVFGPNELSLPSFSPGPPVVFAGASIDRQVLWIWGLTILAVAGLTFLYSKTKLGRAMRACSLSHDAARLMGIDTAAVVMVSVRPCSRPRSAGGCRSRTVDADGVRRGRASGSQGVRCSDSRRSWQPDRRRCGRLAPGHLGEPVRRVHLKHVQGRDIAGRAARGLVRAAAGSLRQVRPGEGVTMARGSGGKSQDGQRPWRRLRAWRRTASDR